MSERVSVVAIIPARSGSKGIPHKNILPFRGRPLMAHAIEQARASRLVDRVIVSTDSPAYAELARQHGAEAPFLRPAEISGDLATDLEVFQHALRWLREQEGYVPDLCLHLRPTSPLRTPAQIDAAIRLLVDSPDCDAVRSVVPAPHTPFKMWRIAASGLLTPVADAGVPDAWNRPRQELPATYLQNACIDVVRARVILEQGSMTGQRIKPFVMEQLSDIDTPEDWNRAEQSARVEFTGKTLVVDIDGVIASLTPDNNYARAEPLVRNIALINRLHDAGNRIVLFTARGTMTGMDWQAVTAAQMQAWGVRHHELKFGKPAADFYVDDRAIRIEEIHEILARQASEGGTAS